MNTERGFAVVAAEIQKLSQQSSLTASEIKDIVNNLSSHLITDTGQSAGNKYNDWQTGRKYTKCRKKFP